MITPLSPGDPEVARGQGRRPDDGTSVYTPPAWFTATYAEGSAQPILRSPKGIPVWVGSKGKLYVRRQTLYT